MGSNNDTPDGKIDWENAELLQQLGLVIAERRKKLNMTQDELAALSGVNRAFISNIEQGYRNPSINAVANLARGLRIRFSVLLARCEERLKRTE